MKHSPSQKEIAEIIKASQKKGSIHLTGTIDERRKQLRSLKKKVSI